jgi:pimeloyl-ACP methyl ester carboxylesterase
VGGRPAPGYDVQLARSLALPDGPIPDLWKQFGALYRVPALVIRGALSDLLAESTVREMHRRHPRIATHTVPNEGHAPMLRDARTQQMIHDFLMETDETGL